MTAAAAMMQADASKLGAVCFCMLPLVKPLQWLVLLHKARAANPAIAEAGAWSLVELSCLLTSNNSHVQCRPHQCATAALLCSSCLANRAQQHACPLRSALRLRPPSPLETWFCRHLLAGQGCLCTVVPVGLSWRMACWAACSAEQP